MIFLQGELIMGIRCNNCNYEMKTCQEFISVATHIEADSWGEMKVLLKRASENKVVSGLLQNILQSPPTSCGCHDLIGGVENLNIGEPLEVKCPKCGNHDQWEDSE